MDFSKIKEARKAAKITQEQLAKELGINRATLSKYEKGVIEPSISQIRKIANILGVNLIDLIPEEMQGSAIAADIIDRAGLTLVPAAKPTPISDIDKFSTEELFEELQSRIKEDPTIITRLNRDAKNMDALSDDDYMKIAQTDGIPVDFLLSQQGKARLEKTKQFLSTIDQDGFLDFLGTLHDMYLKVQTEEGNPSETTEEKE